MRGRSYHACGGSIVSAAVGSYRYRYCDTCLAFAAGDARMPSGTNQDANQAAWDSGEECSPDDPALPTCQAGDWDGDACEADWLDEHERVRVLWVPDEHRDTATAAGSWRGVSCTSFVCIACAERMVQHDERWVRILPDAYTWYLAPRSRPDDEWAAGVEANVFPSAATAEAEIPHLARAFGDSEDEWVAVRRAP